MPGLESEESPPCVCFAVGQRTRLGLACALQGLWEKLASCLGSERVRSLLWVPGPV